MKINNWQAFNEGLKKNTLAGYAFLFAGVADHTDWTREYKDSVDLMALIKFDAECPRQDFLADLAQAETNEDLYNWHDGDFDGAPDDVAELMDNLSEEFGANGQMEGLWEVPSGAVEGLEAAIRQHGGEVFKTKEL